MNCLRFIHAARRVATTSQGRYLALRAVSATTQHIFCQQQRTTPLGSCHSRLFASSATVQVADCLLETTALDLAKQLSVERKQEELEYTESRNLAAFLDRTPWVLVQSPGDRFMRLVARFGNDRVVVRIELSDPEAQENENVVVPVHVLVSKKTDTEDHGTLVFQLTVHNGDYTIEKIHLERDSKVADPQTVEDTSAQFHSYPGPHPNELDRDLIDRFHDYLLARYVNSDLCNFVQLLYISKEQREYMRWMRDVGSFLNK